jgi:hypothetical protein
MTSSRAALQTIIDAELRRTTQPAVAILAEQLAQRAGAYTVAVLFYGSALRTNDLDGVLDYYVLLDRASAWPGSRLAAMANRLLPPNVGYVEADINGQRVRAKYAVMRLDQFRARMSVRSLDTTLWARFSQPCVCAWSRSGRDRAWVAGAIADAVLTAARWAAYLGPESGVASDFWRALFARTYGAELRVESTDRGGDIVACERERYDALLPLAWQTIGLNFGISSDGRLMPNLPSSERRAGMRRWSRRQRLGKPLNIVRLLKAAFTFAGAMDYVAWKVERHSGVHIEVSPWQRRFPWLAAPGLYWRLRKRGVLR